MVLMNTSQWIDFVVSETETALALLYSYMKFHKLLTDQENVNQINKNSEFWMLHNGAVQRALFLYLGRLGDDSQDGKSFSDFNAHCIQNVSDFSRQAFLARKPAILDVNPAYLEGKTEPSVDDLKALFKMARPHNGFLRGACRDIRNRVFAHAILTEEHEYANLFAKVSLGEIEEALLVYWSISQHLWQCFHNARSVEPIKLEYSGKEGIANNLEAAIHGPSNRRGFVGAP